MSGYTYGFNERPGILVCIPHGSSVLEVGCGRGGFGMGLRRDRGVTRSVGIELNEAAAEEARKYFDEVLCGPYPDVLEGRTDRYDCVVFNDVLEHLTDPWEALQRAKSLLNPGGMVVASIPNARVLNVSLRLLGGDWRYEDQGVLDRTHLRFFTRRSLLRMLDETGFDVTYIHAINPMPRFRRFAPYVKDRGRVRRTLADLIHIQFAVTATPRA